jgi:hypothetical protein
MNIGGIASHLAFDNHRLSQTGAGAQSAQNKPQDTRNTDAKETGNSQTKPVNENDTKLEPSELREIQKLKMRDREVRAHEAAHVAAGGSLVRSGAQFTMRRGPDGVMYAIGGEVSIDTSPASTPEATLSKAEQIRRAALAPAEPSGPDRAVAAKAAQMAAKARMEIAHQQRAGADPEAQQANGISQYLQISSLAEETSIDDVI